MKDGMKFITLATAATLLATVAHGLESVSLPASKVKYGGESYFLVQHTKELKAIGNSTNYKSNGNATELAIGDYCDKVVGCLGHAAATAAAFTYAAGVFTANYCTQLGATVTTMLKDDNYKLTKQIASGIATQFVIPVFAVGATTYYINAKQAMQTKGSPDQCSLGDIPDIAAQGVDAVYNFCLQLKQVTFETAGSRIDFATVSDDSTNDDVGVSLLSQNYISTVKNKLAPECSLLGVTF
ncbi:hypothetical protein INT43_001818 [Umbelopsis isabellina]|uniref:Uncharacterized protein n=1 Tax=Mortierella isabellina TaxID=91625 RepID=A0A8H7UB17_MORIS|nr:hypothetical protein INT43_001818 [Umbelopsis isabellina]